MTTHQWSPVIRLLDSVWEHTNEATTHSWDRLNRAMQAALEMAVGAGFSFAPDDIQHIMSNYRSDRWVGESIEWLYKLAIVVENNTAILSYENAVDRKPFFGKNVTIESSLRWSHSSFISRRKERLCVGSRFQWQEYRPTVTSFANDSSTLTACVYADRKDGARKIAKRFTIKHDDLET